MSIRFYLSFFAAAAGIPLVAMLAAPQLATTVQTKPKAEVHDMAASTFVPRLLAPTRGATRFSPTSKSETKRQSDFSLADTQANDADPFKVMLDGRVIAATPVSRSMAATLAPGQWYNLSVFVPATQQNELFILGIPNIPATLEAPLLVGMRQGNVSHGDVHSHTTFWDECLVRGWYFLAPLSRGLDGYGTTSGSILNAQENTKAALAWVTSNYPIDGDRIYGVGFSAGAGLLASYAGRYLDPAEPMFAAIVYHTGFSDLVDIYNNGGPAGQGFLEFLLGGAPTGIPHEYRRIASLELNASRQWLLGGDHGAWNLGSIPTQIWYATNDLDAGLVLHTTELFDWMNLNGNGPVELFTGVSQDSTSGYHNWDVLDEAQICDWFDLQTLTPPVSGDLLIDREAIYHGYAVQQDSAERYSRLSFAKTVANNELSLTRTKNIHRITLSPNDLSLSTAPGAFLTLNLGAINLGDEIVLEGVQTPPVAVQRDMVINNTWVYSAAQQTLTVSELYTGPHTWTLQF